MSRILLNDDDDALLLTLERTLVEAGHAVVVVTYGAKAAQLFRREPFEVIITDLIMPNREGLETIVELRREFSDIRVIAISGGGGNARLYLDLATRLGAPCTLLKPFKPEQLRYAVADVTRSNLQPN